MSAFTRDDVTLHYLDEGPKDGAPLVFIHELGLSLHLWDALLPLLPEGLRVIRLDLRGHGGSDSPPPPYAMGALVRDVEALLDHLGIREAVVAGLGLGGMVAQGLAVKRLDQVRALVLMGTAAKIGHAAHWQALIDQIEATGAEAFAEHMLPRWLTRKAQTEGADSALRRSLAQQSTEGLIGAISALSGTDFYTPTSGLRLSALGLAGSEDAMVPPDLMRETINLIPGAAFSLIRRSGHLLPLDQPEATAEHLSGFLKAIGHV